MRSVRYKLAGWIMYLAMIVLPEDVVFLMAPKTLLDIREFDANHKD